MSDRSKKRITQLEQEMIPLKREIWLRTFGYKFGKDGEAVRDETDAQAIARHLAEQPQDEGAEFNFIHIVGVHPKGLDSEGNNVW